MIITDEDALICDFAEYYHIFDFRALPVKYAATLACGLCENSRIKKRLSGTSCDTSTLLLAAAVDRLSLLWWAQTKDGYAGENAPARVFDVLIGAQATDDGEMTFESGEDFEIEYKKIARGG